MTRIIIEGGDDRLVELLEVATRQGRAPTVEPEPERALDSNLLAAWLAEQADDPALETAMMQGSLGSSPFEAVMAALIQRAAGFGVTSRLTADQIVLNGE